MWNMFLSGRTSIEMKNLQNDNWIISLNAKG